MQLGTFRSVLAGFLSQLGIGPWSTGSVVVTVTLPSVRVATVRSLSPRRTVLGKP
jgi:hypothetical protein